MRGGRVLQAGAQQGLVGILLQRVVGGVSLDAFCVEVPHQIRLADVEKEVAKGGVSCPDEFAVNAEFADAEGTAQREG